VASGGYHHDTAAGAVIGGAIGAVAGAGIAQGTC